MQQKGSRPLKTRKNVELLASDVEWLTESHPGLSLSGVLTMLLHEYRAVFRDIGATPKKIARDAAREVADVMIDNEIQDEIHQATSNLEKAV